MSYVLSRSSSRCEELAYWPPTTWACSRPENEFEKVSTKWRRSQIKLPPLIKQFPFLAHATAT